MITIFIVGSLILKHRFNGERTIRIRASDNGTPRKYTEKNIIVKFESDHRKWQFFPKRKYDIGINSSATPGTLLLDFFQNSK